MNVYAKSHTINVWVKIITQKFYDLEFKDRAKNIGTILNITSKAELKKINEASLIVFGRSLGVETFEDACKKLGKSPILPKFIDMDEATSTKFMAEYKIITIIKALNECWYPNWNDGDESKYFPYFGMSGDKCVFSYWGTGDCSADTYVPSALFLKTAELATYCGLKFTSLYEEYYK